MTEDSQKIEEREDEAVGLSEDTVDQVLDAVETADASQLDALLTPLHAADVADVLEQIGSAARRDLLRLWTGGMDGEVLSELDEGLREEVIESLEPQELAEAVRDLDSDDVVDLIEDLDEPQQEAILEVLDDADRVAVEQALAYPEESAGRLMQREMVMGPTHWTVGEAIDYMRQENDLPDQFYHLILVEANLKPVAHVTLGRLLAAKRATKLMDLAEEGFRTISVTQPEEDVAYLFNQYHLISAPVVDGDDRLVGVITIDDAMVVLDEEHEEDMLRMAGAGDGSLSDSVFETTRQRFPWLFVNLITAILASAVIALFVDVIEQIVALAIVMPIVASMGGNAGTQTMAVTVRAIATRDLTAANIGRVIWREAGVGLINGLLFAVILGVVGILWFNSPLLGLVLGMAMVVNLLVACLSGILVPVLLEKADQDPALASGTLVTTMTDVVGFFVFLALAKAILL